VDERNDKALLRLRVAQLGEKFLQRTRDETVILRGLIERVSQGDPIVIAQLEQLAHKIHGTGATFGFAAVSERAREIEHLMEGLKVRDPSGGAAIAPQVLQHLIEYTEQLAQEVEAAAAR
jgi:HPt (histidine-containing phosphotransfer) domain-containing protein